MIFLLCSTSIGKDSLTQGDFIKFILQPQVKSSKLVIFGSEVVRQLGNKSGLSGRSGSLSLTGYSLSRRRVSLTEEDFLS